MYCGKCGKSYDNEAFCGGCGTRGGQGYSYCRSCGATAEKGNAVCPACGGVIIPDTLRKKRGTAGVLAIFLGFLGIHNFYLGYSGKAAAQLLIALLGLLPTCGISFFAVWIWAVVDGIRILNGAVTADGAGVPLKS